MLTTYWEDRPNSPTTGKVLSASSNLMSLRKTPWSSIKAGSSSHWRRRNWLAVIKKRQPREASTTLRRIANSEALSSRSESRQSPRSYRQWAMIGIWLWRWKSAWSIWNTNSKWRKRKWSSSEDTLSTSRALPQRCSSESRLTLFSQSNQLPTSSTRKWTRRQPPPFQQSSSSWICLWRLREG